MFVSIRMTKQRSRNCGAFCFYRSGDGLQPRCPSTFILGTCPGSGAQLSARRLGIPDVFIASGDCSIVSDTSSTDRKKTFRSLSV